MAADALWLPQYKIKPPDIEFFLIWFSYSHKLVSKTFPPLWGITLLEHADADVEERSKQPHTTPAPKGVMLRLKIRRRRCGLIY